MTQDYLRHSSLEDLSNNYGIKCNVCDALGVVSLNYSMIDSDMSQQICQECRGLILEIDTWEVVSRSFTKFFNIGEPLAAQTMQNFDWSTAQAYEKLDGSLISMYYYKDQWNAATRGVADANTEVYGYGVTFAEVIQTAMIDMGFKFSELNPDIWYSFELTSPLNRQVVEYQEYDLTLLAAWSRITGNEIPLSCLPEITAPKAKMFPMTDLATLTEEVNKLDPFKQEGVVLVDGNFNRLKLKSMKYIEIFHAMQGIQNSFKNRVEAILSENFDDILSVLPEYLQNELLALQATWKEMVETIKEKYEEYKHIENPREFANAVKDFRWNPWVFNLKRGQSIEESTARTLLATKITMVEDFLNMKKTAECAGDE